MSKFQNIDINIGSPMQIEFESVKFRFKTDFVGMVHHSFLIVKMPSSKSLNNIAKIFSQGRNTIVRFVHKGIAYGFPTKVNCAVVKPAKLLFLDYPKNVEAYRLRNHERVLCLLPADLVMSSGSTIPGHVTDISKTGCLLTAENTAFYNKEELPSKDSILAISLQLPGFENTISISSKVKNINPTKDQIKMGLKFVSMSDDAHERLFDFLESVGVD
ncbi:pilus assembly protein PilZ [Candidatus Magnetomorum sp. HK-1]|nr:pilus assembly protein PilZ [Candidatus Magnetomorum sp. HK-1]